MTKYLQSIAGSKKGLSFYTTEGKAGWLQYFARRLGQHLRSLQVRLEKSYSPGCGLGRLQGSATLAGCILVT